MATETRGVGLGLFVGIAAAVIILLIFAFVIDKGPSTAQLAALEAENARLRQQNTTLVEVLGPQGIASLPADLREELAPEAVENAALVAEDAAVWEQLDLAPDLVGVLWVRDQGPTQVRVFADDGTALLGSCTDGWRLAAWERTEKGRVAWTAGAGRMEAEVAELTDDRLVLKVEGREQAWTRAEGPLDCPE